MSAPENDNNQELPSEWQMAFIDGYHAQTFQNYCSLDPKTQAGIGAVLKIAIRGQLATQSELLRKATEALERLIELKDHKDKSGKTLWYESEQPGAWKIAKETLKAIREAGV